MPILIGLDGKQKMGKSLGNYTGVGEPANEQFGKVMKIADELMPQWFTLLTDRPPKEIATLTDRERTHPRQAKETLGKDVVTFYHGAAAAEAAAAEFRARFAEKQDPTDIPEKPVPAAGLRDGKLSPVELLRPVGLAPSNNEARRLVAGGAANVRPPRQRHPNPAAPRDAAG